jgi:hypothetical protein
MPLTPGLLFPAVVGVALARQLQLRLLLQDGVEQRGVAVGQDPLYKGAIGFLVGQVVVPDQKVVAHQGQAQQVVVRCFHQERLWVPVLQEALETLSLL